MRASRGVVEPVVESGPSQPSSRFAQDEVEVSVELSRRLPLVVERLRAGHFDEAKAEAFVDVLSVVDEETARRIASRLVDRAERWTLAELRERLRYHVKKALPQVQRRRHAQGVAQRDVYHPGPRRPKRGPRSA